MTENLIVEHLILDFVRLNFGFDQLIYSYRLHHVMTDRLILILVPRKYKLHLEEKQVHSKLLALSLIRSTKTDLNPESSSSLHIDRHYFSHWVSHIIIATSTLLTQLGDDNEIFNSYLSTVFIMSPTFDDSGYFNHLCKQ